MIYSKLFNKNMRTITNIKTNVFIVIVLFFIYLFWQKGPVSRYDLWNCRFDTKGSCRMYISKLREQFEVMHMSRSKIHYLFITLLFLKERYNQSGNDWYLTICFLCWSSSCEDLRSITAIGKLLLL